MRVGKFVVTMNGTGHPAPMYPTYLTASQWQVIKDLLADQRKRNRGAGAT